MSWAVLLLCYGTLPASLCCWKENLALACTPLNTEVLDSGQCLSGLCSLPIAVGRISLCSMKRGNPPMQTTLPMSLYNICLDHLNGQWLDHNGSQVPYQLGNWVTLLSAWLRSYSTVRGGLSKRWSWQGMVISFQVSTIISSELLILSILFRCYGTVVEWVKGQLWVPNGQFIQHLPGYLDLKAWALNKKILWPGKISPAIATIFVNHFTKGHHRLSTWLLCQPNCRLCCKLLETCGNKIFFLWARGLYMECAYEYP